MSLRPAWATQQDYISAKQDRVIKLDLSKEVKCAVAPIQSALNTAGTELCQVFRKIYALL